MVSDFEAVQNALVTKSAVILDARSEGRFSGKMPEPRENLPSGHMPGALNIPFDRVIDQQAGTLKDTRQLQVIFNKYLPTERQKIITSCGSGMTACILSLALDELGYDSSVYDGSWTEWASKGRVILSRQNQGNSSASHNIKTVRHLFWMGFSRPSHRPNPTGLIK